MDKFAAFVPESLSIKIASGIAVFAVSRIPQEKVRSFLKKTFYAAGVAMTLGLSKFKYTAGIYNATIEPVFINVLDSIVYAVKEGFVKGLRSDAGISGEFGEEKPEIKID